MNNENENKNKKCMQYEGYFIFQDEEKFKEHLKSCPDCAEEHEKFMKISALIKEAAPAYLKRECGKQSKRLVQKLACCFILFAGLASYTGYQFYGSYIYQAGIDQNSEISAMGLPVDEYGFLAI